MSNSIEAGQVCVVAVQSFSWCKNTHKRGIQAQNLTHIRSSHCSVCLYCPSADGTHDVREPLFSLEL